MTTRDSQPTGAVRTLLVVDDQLGVRETLKFVLTGAGYNVVSAESGENAITLAASEPIDAALIDVHMPTMSGFEACDRLRAQAEQNGRPFRMWLMTGAGSTEMERRAHQCGTLGLFRKPFDLTKLVSELETGFASAIPRPLSATEAPVVPKVRTLGDYLPWKGK
jgi:two-component system phosphate regulon response regulator PhoB